MKGAGWTAFKDYRTLGLFKAYMRTRKHGQDRVKELIAVKSERDAFRVERDAAWAAVEEANLEI